MVEANIQLQDSTLRAPYDGVIARRFVEEGQNIRANEPVVSFQDVEEIEIAVDVPESVMVADIQPADIMRMLAEFSGAPGLQFPVRIREIAQVADPTTQTFQVRAVMQAPEDHASVLPGMTATVAVTYRRASILGESHLGADVGRFTRRRRASKSRGSSTRIGIGRAPAGRSSAPPTGGAIEIADGLEPGERIAVAGVTFLREGHEGPRPGRRARRRLSHESRRALDPQQPHRLRRR